MESKYVWGYVWEWEGVGGGGTVGGDGGRSIVWIWVSGLRGVRWRWQ